MSVFTMKNVSLSVVLLFAAAAHCESYSPFEGDREGFVEGVDVISGVYTDHPIDLTGTIRVQRHYVSSRQDWALFPSTRIVVGTEWDEMDRENCKRRSLCKAYVGQFTGAFVEMIGLQNVDQRAVLKIDPETIKGVTNMARGEIATYNNLKNLTLHWDPSNEQMVLTLVDGPIWFFERCAPIACPYFTEEHIASHDLTDPQHYRLVCEQWPNDDELRFYYNEPGHLEHISVLANGRTAGLRFIYHDTEVNIVSSEGQRVRYLFQDGLLRQVISSERAALGYTYDTYRQLVQINSPFGVEWEIVYDSHRRVSSLFCAGQNDDLVQIASFAYGDSWTDAYDADGCQRHFGFDERNRLTSIAAYDSDGDWLGTKYKTWGKGPNTLNLLAEEIKRPQPGQTHAAASADQSMTI